MTTLVKFTGLYVDPWVRALQGGEFAAADRLQLVTVFKYLEFCLEQVGGGAGGRAAGLHNCREFACKPAPAPATRVGCLQFGVRCQGCRHAWSSHRAAVSLFPPRW